MSRKERHFAIGDLDMDITMDISDGLLPHCGKPYIIYNAVVWPRVSDGRGAIRISAACRRYVFRAIRERLTGKASHCRQINGCKCWAGY